jgi:hypothetical protein
MSVEYRQRRFPMRTSIGTAAAVTDLDPAAEEASFAEVTPLDGMPVFDAATRVSNSLDHGNADHRCTTATLRSKSIGDIGATSRYCGWHDVEVAGHVQ